MEITAGPSYNEIDGIRYIDTVFIIQCVRLIPDILVFIIIIKLTALYSVAPISCNRKQYWQSFLI